jgi:2-isopropylmalate synthase
LIDEMGADVGLDWHGHNDRGLGLANSLAALEAGAERIHATALGLGERVGNTQMEILLVNLKLLGIRDDDLTALPDYVRLVSEATGIAIPVNAPVVGRDAFRTATGVHAAAVVKARRKGNDPLADRIYSAVPASWVGRRQRIAVGHLSGAANVRQFLEQRDIPSTDELVHAVLTWAKSCGRVLTDAEVLECVQQHAGVHHG